MLDALSSPVPVVSGPAGGASLSALEAAGSDLDLAAHLGELVERGELHGFLEQTGDAVALAVQSPVFAEQLDPLLARIHGALDALPTQALTAATRDAVEATVAQLAGHLGTDAAGNASGVPGGGLEAHEAAGGHLIERHVGKSEAWLVDRVQRENISAASSFRTLPAAEHFVAGTLDEHGPRIDAWLGGQGGNRLVVDARFDASTGISVARGEREATDVFSVRLVLERSDQLDTGYRIVTGYPTPP